MADQTPDHPPNETPDRNSIPPPAEPRAADPAPPDRGAPTEPPAGRTPGRTYWILPVVALLLGGVLGGVLVGVSRSDTSSGGAAGSPTATAPGGATASPSQDVSVSATVPAECLEAADKASAALSQVQQGLSALRDLRASDLRDVLDQLQIAQPEISDLAQQCRDRAQLPSVSPAG